MPCLCSYALGDRWVHSGKGNLSDVEVIIGPEDNGKKVVVNVGGILRLGFLSNPSTGYTWEMAEQDRSVLELLDQGFIPSDPSRVEVVGSSSGALRPFLRAGPS